MFIGLPFMQATHKQQTHKWERWKRKNSRQHPRPERCGFCSWRKSAYNTQSTYTCIYNKYVCMYVHKCTYQYVWHALSLPVCLSIACACFVNSPKTRRVLQQTPPPQPAPVAAAIAAAVVVVQCWWIVLQSSSSIHRSTLTAAVLLPRVRIIVLIPNWRGFRTFCCSPFLSIRRAAGKEASTAAQFSHFA